MGNTLAQGNNMTQEHSEENMPANQDNKQQDVQKKTKKYITKRRYKPLTPQLKNRIIKAVEETGDWKAAISRFNVTKTAFHAALKRDLRLAERIEIAENLYLDSLETEARRRAVNGVEKGVYFQGERVGTEKEYSDRLLDKLLTAADKEKYSQQRNVKQETTVNVTSDGVRKKLSSMLDLDLSDDQPTSIEDDVIEGKYDE